MKIRLNIEALRHRDYRIYFLSNAVALHGLWIQRTTIAWLAWDLSNSAAVVGFIGFLTFGPTMISGPVFGALVDRAPVLRSARLTQSGLVGLSLALALFNSAGVLGLTALSILALLIGIVTSAYHPVRMSLAPLLAPVAAISSVVNATAINFNLARSVGPALAGLLIANFGVGTALWITVCCGLPNLVMLSVIRPRDRSASAATHEGVLAGLAEGFRMAWSNRFTRLVLATTGLASLLGRGMLEILPLVADGIFARGPAGLGTLTSVAGLGALTAAGLGMLLPAPRAGVIPLPAQVAALLGMAMGIVIANSTVWPVTVGAVALLGACGTVVGVSLQSALQAQLPDDYRGRIMSLWVMSGIGGAALGALALGAIADVLGLALGTLCLYSATILVSLLLFRRRIL